MLHNIPTQGAPVLGSSTGCTASTRSFSSANQIIVNTLHNISTQGAPVLGSSTGCTASTRSSSSSANLDRLSQRTDSY